MNSGPAPKSRALSAAGGWVKWWEPTSDAHCAEHGRSTHQSKDQVVSGRQATERLQSGASRPVAVHVAQAATGHSSPACPDASSPPHATATPKRTRELAQGRLALRRRAVLDFEQQLHSRAAEQGQCVYRGSVQGQHVYRGSVCTGSSTLVGGGALAGQSGEQHVGGPCGAGMCTKLKRVVAWECPCTNKSQASLWGRPPACHVPWCLLLHNNPKVWCHGGRHPTLTRCAF